MAWPSSMWPLNLTDSSSPQRPLQEFDKGLRDVYGPDSTNLAILRIPQAPCPTNARQGNRAIETRSRRGHTTVQATSRLQHPTPEDWQCWKLDILRWYRYGAASTIVKRLRGYGYNVTIKMLRDRLRDWGANTKTKRSPPDIDSVVGPLRGPKTGSADFGRRNLLKEMNRWYDTAWGRAEVTAEPNRPDTYLLCQFMEIAPAAIRQGIPTAWASISKVADRIVNTDWSLLSPIGLFVLAQQTVRIAHENALSPFIEIWHTILTRDLHQAHPIALLLNYFLAHRNEPDLWHALCRMYECKVTIYEEAQEQEEIIAEARYWLAHMCLLIDQESKAEKILDRYVALADRTRKCEISPNRRCKIDALLGRSSFYQGCYDKAVLRFRRARDFDNGKDVAWTGLSAEYFVESAVRTDQMAKAIQIVGKLSEQLHASIEGLAPKNNTERIRPFDELKYLSEMLEGHSDLEEAIGNANDL